MLFHLTYIRKLLSSQPLLHTVYDVIDKCFCWFWTTLYFIFYTSVISPSHFLRNVAVVRLLSLILLPLCFFWGYNQKYDRVRQTKFCLILVMTNIANVYLPTIFEFLKVKNKMNKEMLVFLNSAPLFQSFKSVVLFQFINSLMCGQCSDVKSSFCHASCCGFSFFFFT